MWELSWRWKASHPYLPPPARKIRSWANNQIYKKEWWKSNRVLQSKNKRFKRQQQKTQQSIKWIKQTSKQLKNYYIRNKIANTKALFFQWIVTWAGCKEVMFICCTTVQWKCGRSLLSLACHISREHVLRSRYKTRWKFFMALTKTKCRASLQANIVLFNSNCTGKKIFRWPWPSTFGTNLNDFFFVIFVTVSASFDFFVSCHRYDWLAVLYHWHLRLF